MKIKKEERIAGAPLDVYSQAPLPKDFPFFTLDNVITTPWIASITPETFTNMELTCVENILRVFRGEGPLYALDVSIWEKLNPYQFFYSVSLGPVAASKTK